MTLEQVQVILSYILYFIAISTIIGISCSTIKDIILCSKGYFICNKYGYDEDNKSMINDAIETKTYSSMEIEELKKKYDNM